VSAKDLIPNHLTMSLYNHVEIWKDRPEMWPKGIYCNGHIMVDAEKMVKNYDGYCYTVLIVFFVAMNVFPACVEGYANNLTDYG
jgi:hypothetical protein